MIESCRGFTPEIDPLAYVHDSAVLMGRVRVGKDSSIWPHCTLRGDDGSIVIGERTSIQDGTVVHLTSGLSNTVVGDDVTVGHKAILHGCQIGNFVLVGMGAIILDNAQIGEYSLIGAGAVITAGKVIPPRSLVLGSPAKVIREVGERELMMIQAGALSYVEKTREFLATRRSR
jgi:carbonic anhydrase/acetyltransferase-like protein (isoleucine patch superfamily)